MFESAYYSEENKKIPTYIHDVFKNGIPADFRLIGATTRKPEEIPEAVRSRCVEIYFNPLTRDNIEKIIYGAAERIKINIEQNAVEMIARYAKTQMKELELTLNRFEQAGVKVNGFILNDIQRSSAGYGYGYNYAYAYKAAKDD